MRELIARLRDWLRRDQLDAELSEELRFHRQMLERDAAGLEPNAMRRSVRERLGNLTQIRETARERWTIPWLDHLQQDVRYAIRGLSRSPGFTVAVVLTLGLGIGANAAMFGIVDRLMFRPHEYLRDPETVHRVYLRMPGQRRLLTRESMPYSRYLDLKKWTTSFSEYAAFFPTTVAVGSGESARERPIAAVTASFFGFFDAAPVRGRFFVAAEDTTPIGAEVAVLDHGFWMSDLGGRDVIGESILVDNILCTIIGIAPPGFAGVADGKPPAIYLPMTTFGGHQGGRSSLRYWVNYNWDWAEVMVRRKPGVTLDAASADLTAAYARSRDAARAVHSWMPRTDAVAPLAVAGAIRTAAGPYPGLEARTLLWVSSVAVIVLLIACANVANLMLARTLARRRETALRLALGVTRGRLAAHAITESLVLSILGCVTGVAIAHWGGRALGGLLLPDASQFAVATDWRTLAVVATATLVAASVVSIAPILTSRRERLASALKAGAREGTYRRSRLRTSLLIVQGALSVSLLIGAGLFVRSLDRVRQLRIGYDVDPIVLVRWQRRGAQMTPQEQAIVRARVLDAARTMPGVRHTAWASNIPLQGTSTMPLFVPGIDSVARIGRFTYQTAGPEYFEAMGTRILRGRAFSSTDGADGAPTVIVSSEMARVLWPGRDALGQCIHLQSASAPCTTVVGIAEDAVHDPINDEPLRYYLPLDQYPNEGTSLLVLRTEGATGAFNETVRRALQAAMPGQQYVTVTPMRDLLDQRRRSWQLGATMFVAFGVLALVVAAVGLYGVIAYDVAQRRHELGIRIALGAQGTDVLRLVIGNGLRLAAFGVVAGSTIALIAGRWVQPLLFQQSARDPMVFGTVGTVLILVALVASLVPASRAVRADPNTVLRVE